MSKGYYFENALGKSVWVTVRQIEMLARFVEPARFKPTRAGLPWQEMNALVRHGLLVVERRQVSRWAVAPHRWEPEGSSQHWAWATPAGLRAIDRWHEARTE